MLKFLYQTSLGRILLKPLVHPAVSRLAGRFCDSKFSNAMIPYFIRKNGIDMEEYAETDYESFNQFFCRKIKAECRPVDSAEDALVAPCDGLLSIYPIEKGMVIPVKQSRFGIADLLKDERLAGKYNGGTCLVFRLCVNHYHRYMYPDNGSKSENIFIPGVLHTVRPIALRGVPVFVENSREYTILHTKNFGDIVQMEVGAMLVGRIKNHHGKSQIKKGQEKGYFEYGGSTIILLIKQGITEFPNFYYQLTNRGEEFPVKQGERLNER
ncbi:MAG: phosphatidylserine decarboxylase [Eubacteriales bacterium]|nr:phosphatidylserine decarboxylase [Eubacteriales bacterium]